MGTSTMAGGEVSAKTFIRPLLFSFFKYLFIYLRKNKEEGERETSMITEKHCSAALYSTPSGDDACNRAYALDLNGTQSPLA